ncbi:MAG: TIM barrel protein [Bacteroidota bacterium]|nr:TIM barrel protein [Bacteroidota bacterium]
MNRRNFIQTTGLSAAGISLAGAGMANSILTSKAVKRPICAFTKCLQFLNFDEMGEVLARLGFDGADMPVRPGGQVEPADVKTGLPHAVKTLRKYGMEIPMIVTAITDPADPISITTLQAAADSGIKYYRTGWLKYNESKTIQQNLDEHRKTIEKHAELNEKLGIHGDYQNHSGASVGSPVWDLYELMKNVDPKHMGVQYDIRHAVAEGVFSWKLGMKRIAPWITTIDIKDSVFEKTTSGAWKTKNVFLGEGMVNFDEFLKEYARLKVEAPISIHYEYDLGGAELGKKETTMNPMKIYEMMKKDLFWLREAMNKQEIEF